MRVLLQNADMPAYQKMPCVLIFPAKWKNQQINMHASRILAKLLYFEIHCVFLAQILVCGLRIYPGIFRSAPENLLKTTTAVKAAAR